MVMESLGCFSASCLLFLSVSRSFPEPEGQPGSFVTPLCVLVGSAPPVMSVSVLSGLGQLRILSISKHVLSALSLCRCKAVEAELLGDTEESLSSL